MLKKTGTKDKVNSLQRSRKRGGREKSYTGVKKLLVKLGADRTGIDFYLNGKERGRVGYPKKSGVGFDETLKCILISNEIGKLFVNSIGSNVIRELISAKRRRPKSKRIRPRKRSLFSFWRFR